jgi:hypothetical protein
VQADSLVVLAAGRIAAAEPTGEDERLVAESKIIMNRNRIYRWWYSINAAFQASIFTWDLIWDPAYAWIPGTFLVVMLAFVLKYTRAINRMSRAVDWGHVRRMELEAYGRTFHDEEGNQQGG